MTDGTEDYKFAAAIYDPVLERWLKTVREKTLEASGVKPRDKVLEVCCGTGRQAELYAQREAVVLGIDLSVYMIAKAKKKEKENLSFVQGDATDLPYDDSCFDLSSTGFSLHEVDEKIREKFLREMQRVTRKGGSLIFVDFSVQTQNGFLNRFYSGLTRSIEWLAGGDHYMNYCKWMNDGGLKGFIERYDLKTNDTISMRGGGVLIARIENRRSSC